MSFENTICYVLIILGFCVNINYGNRPITKETMLKYRDKVSTMFHYAYENYLHYAYPYDELRPLSCDGVDTWGKFSLTLIDALDTLAVMGNYSEFRRVADIVTGKIDFDINVNVSVFETNIRIIGGLLSAHLLSKQAGMDLEAGWPCSGPFLSLAESVAKRILPAFDTKTGMPYGTINLRHGVPPGETAITCTAGVATYIVEFGTLSRLTGDPTYENVAMKALNYLWEARSSLGLVGNHIDVQSGKWTALDSGIGAGVDSYFEYLVKGSILLQSPLLMKMFEEYKTVITKYNRHDDWYLWVGMNSGKITLPIFQSLEAFWPGVLSLIGDIDQAMKTIHNYQQISNQYGFTPEFYNILQHEVYNGREGYPLRPELVESAYYLYQATKDPFLLQIGMDVVEAIEHSAKTPCGYATIKDVRSHKTEDRMESFFLAETTKYLYLLFDEDNFISKHHKPGLRGNVIMTPRGECITNSGGYIFNTEAHPIDISAVHCCSKQRQDDELFLETLHDNLDLVNVLKDSEHSVETFKSKFSRRFTSQMKPATEKSQEQESINGSEDRKAEDDSSPDCHGENCNEDDGVDIQIEDFGDEENMSSSGENEDIKLTPAESISPPIQTVSAQAMLEQDETPKKQPDDSKATNSSRVILRPLYDLLMCPVQPFLSRLSLMGQMFYVD